LRILPAPARREFCGFDQVVEQVAATLQLRLYFAICPSRFHVRRERVVAATAGGGGDKNNQSHNQSLR